MGEITKYGGMRRFRLDRIEDATGVSGTGCVAQGIVFSDGTVTMRWMTELRSTAFYSSIEDVEAIHLHGGKSVLRWEDPICFACGITLVSPGAEFCDTCGASWTGQRPHMETRRDRSLGRWNPALVVNVDEGGSDAD